MAHESFEDPQVAEILNSWFVAIKVDKEERPDIDNAYMNVTVALTGSGGWPMTVFMDAERRPFFAGTYFPRDDKYGRIGIINLLTAIHEEWINNRPKLMTAAKNIVDHFSKNNDVPSKHLTAEQLVNNGINYFSKTFDKEFGGFGSAPKFPAPHNLLFLIEAYRNIHDENSLTMVSKTLSAMARGGIFDHIGFGFSRYSVDREWLVPHFEKMLYDNAMLIMAYANAYEVTKDPTYKLIAEKVVTYLRREMTNAEGGFYSAQDADSDGKEGEYYLFTPGEIIDILGREDGEVFNKKYDVTDRGNFEGKNIPNQIALSEFDNTLATSLSKLYEQRLKRIRPGTDDKILTAWNSLMIAALADASAVFDNPEFLSMAETARKFIENNLIEGTKIYTSYRNSVKIYSGVLDDYAFYIYALLRLYRATINDEYLNRANELIGTIIDEAFDKENGGFYLTSNKAEKLFFRASETHDGAMPSGNSIMAMNLLIINMLTEKYDIELNKQINFMMRKANLSPTGHSFFLYVLLKKDFPDTKIIAVLKDESESEHVADLLRGHVWGIILNKSNDMGYVLKDNKTTYYVCNGNICQKPTNNAKDISS
jgi:uncharacterized protein YyaL (SSP411 family)